MRKCEDYLLSAALALLAPWSAAATAVAAAVDEICGSVGHTNSHQQHTRPCALNALHPIQFLGCSPLPALLLSTGLGDTHLLISAAAPLLPCVLPSITAAAAAAFEGCCICTELKCKRDMIEL